MRREHGWPAAGVVRNLRARLPLRPRYGTFPDGEPPGLARFAGDRRADEPQRIELRAKLHSPDVKRNMPQRIAAIHEWIRAGDVYQLNFTVPYELARARQRGSPVCAAASSGNRWSMGRLSIGRRGGGFFRFHRSCSFAWKKRDGDAAHCDQADERNRGAGAHDARRSRTRGVAAQRPQESQRKRDDRRPAAQRPGTAAKFGSVRAESLFAVERYPTLWQMTSTVTGELRREVGFHEIFRALFPCGSITGAPKVRAMQLMAELEEQPGASIQGRSDFSRRGGRSSTWPFARWNSMANEGTMGVGSGIVIDSDAAEEYDECVLKAEFLTGRRAGFPSGSR